MIIKSETNRTIDSISTYKHMLNSYSLDMNNLLSLLIWNKSDALWNNKYKISACQNHKLAWDLRLLTPVFHDYMYMYYSLPLGFIDD